LHYVFILDPYYENIDIIKIENSSDYHSTGFYNQTLQYQGTHNTRPYFSARFNYEHVTNALVELRWEPEFTYFGIYKRFINIPAWVIIGHDLDDLRYGMNRYIHFCNLPRQKHDRIIFSTRIFLEFSNFVGFFNTNFS